MKLLSSSPFSSSSAPSTSTSNASICNTGNATAGCLSWMLHRLLCFHSLPTQPFDHSIKVPSNESRQFEELHNPEEDKFEDAANPGPGIVARLMGLDPMPEMNLGKNQTGSNSNLIERSQSMNSLEFYFMQRRKHSRSDSTLSLREVPAFLELENDQFFILSFEGGGKDKALKLKPRDWDKGFGEFKQNRADKRKNKNERRESVYERNKENQEMATSQSFGPKENQEMAASQSFGPVGEVEDSSNILRSVNNSIQDDSHFKGEVVKQYKPHCETEIGKRGRSKKKKKETCPSLEKVEAECGSENSSPVSVFDFGELNIDQQVPSSDREYSRLENWNSRRKLSGELENYEHASPCISNSSNKDDNEANRKEEQCFRLWKNSFLIQNYAELWVEICKLAETETMLSNRMYREMRKVEDYEEIVAAFGLEILDQLLSELLDQLTST